MIPKIVCPPCSGSSPIKKCSLPHQKLAGEMAEKLSLGFAWNQTVEGTAFWQSVYNRLYQIKTDGILKED